MTIGEIIEAANVVAAAGVWSPGWAYSEWRCPECSRIASAVTFGAEGRACPHCGALPAPPTPSPGTLTVTAVDRERRTITVSG